MKTKNIFLYLPLLLALMLGAMGCSSDDDETEAEDVNAIRPIDVKNTPIAAFFNTELSGVFGYSTSFFCEPAEWNDLPVPINKNLVYVINSREELSDIYLGEKELPEIDFDNYTLILGQQIMRCLGFYVAKKELVIEDDGLVLNLHARNDTPKNGLIMPAHQSLTFWDLYPKQTQKKITVKAIEEWPNYGGVIP